MTKQKRTRLCLGIGVALVAVHVIVRLVYGVPSDAKQTTLECIGIVFGALFVGYTTWAIMEYVHVQKGGLTSQRKAAHDAIPMAIILGLAGLGLTWGINTWVISEATYLASRRSPLEMINPLDLPESLRPKLEH